MIKVFEAFAGYGSQSMALRRLGIGFEVVGISEIDKYAIQAYMAVHGDTPNYGDISKIDWSSVPDFDFLTYSFPCTDISTAGQQKGLAEGSGTRSSLLWECRKAIEAKRPKYLLMENVKNLVSKKFTPYLKEWLRFLEGHGYSNYTKVLNAKDFGVPQNRERVFMVSILGEASFHFPKPFTLEKRLKDILEKDVDESFYLSERIVKTFLARNEKNKAKGNGFKFEPTMGDVIASAILTCAGTRPCDNYVYVVGNTNPSGHGMNGNVFDPNGLCPTLTTNKGEGPRVLESITCRLCGRNPENPSDRRAGIYTEQFIEFGSNISNCITTVQKDSLVAEPKIIQKFGDRGTSEYSIRDIAHTIPSNPMSDRGQLLLEPNVQTLNCKENGEFNDYINYRIRKLTPREYFRLMGVSEKDIDNIQKSGISKTQQYKMAGNSIVVDVLYYIFKKMFVDKRNEDQQLTLF